MDDITLTDEQVVTMSIPIDEGVNATTQPISYPQVEQVQKQELSSKNEHKIEDIKIKQTTSEKALELYIYENSIKLWKEIFAEDVIECIRQYAEQAGIIEMNKNQLLLSRGSRVDLFIKCQSGNNYLVEIKNPAYGQNETMGGIGQLLYYSMLFPEGNKLVLVSTLYERAFNEVIKKYNLPIDFILFGKDKIYLLKK